MVRGRFWFTLVLAIIVFSLFSALSFGAGCTDPHCLSVDDIPTERPSAFVRQNLVTGNAVTTVSGKILVEIERPGKPSARNVRTRRYPVDVSVATNVSLGLSDVMDFTLNRVKYIASVISFSSENAQLKFMPTREYSNITPGETKVYDVDHDGTADFSLTMGVVESNQARFDITPGDNPRASTLAEPSPVTTVVPSPQDDFGSESASSSPENAPPSSPQDSVPPQDSFQPSPESIPETPSSASVQGPESSFIPPPESIPPTPESSFPPPLDIPSEQPVFSGPPSDSGPGPLSPDAVPFSPGVTETPGEVSSEGLGPVMWGIIIAVFILTVLGVTAGVVLKKEQEHVETVTDYLLKSLAQRVTLPQSMDALSKAGWSKRVTDKALTVLATKYKDDGVAKGADPAAVRSSLTGAGMPEDILGNVFK